MIDQTIQWFLKTSLGRRLFSKIAMEAFHNAHKDLMDTFVGDVEKKAEELMKQNMERLLSVVDERMIVTMNDSQKAIFIGGVRAEPGQLKSLKAEAEFFLQSDLWKILNQTPRELAQRAMFISGDSIDDMKKGRSMLYLLATQQRILDTLKNTTY